MTASAPARTIAPDEPATMAPRRPGGPGSTRAARLAPLLVVGLLAGVVGVMIGWRAAERPPPAPVDEGFVVDMIEHHRQAVQLSEFVLGASDNEAVHAIAQGVISDQRYEIGWMESWLTRHGIARPQPDPDRLSMRWMGMPVPASQMPGIIPQDEVVAFYNLDGAELDRTYLDLLIDHHVGGVHMAEYAVAHAVDPALADMAGRMAVTQQSEINDMRQLLGG